MEKKYKQSRVQKVFSAGQDGRLMLLYIGCYPASPSSQICFLSLFPYPLLPPPAPFHLFLVLLIFPLSSGCAYCLLRWTVTPFGMSCTRPVLHAWLLAVSSSWLPKWPQESWRWGLGCIKCGKSRKEAETVMLLFGNCGERGVVIKGKGRMEEGKKMATKVWYQLVCR